jgi:hypothetical protein
VSHCWLALTGEPPARALASAAARARDGTAAGTLSVWRQSAKPERSAVRVDGRIVDRDGAPAWVSLVLAPAGVRLPFDDPAVQQARRDVLARTSADAVSTLLRDNSHFEGAITVARGQDAARLLVDDPFARVFPARILRIDGGLLGRVTAPVGPTIERYGSANPWPWDRFG